MTELMSLQATGVDPTPVGAADRAGPPGGDARHLVRSLASLGLTKALSWGAAVVLLVMVPRYLGDVSLGKLGFALSLTGICGLFSDLGVTFFLVKQVARAPNNAGVMLINALVIGLVLNSIAALGLLLLVTLGGYDAVTRTVVLVLCVGMVATGATMAVQAVLQGLHRMSTLALAGVVLSHTNAAGVVIVLLAGGGVVPVAIVSVIATLFSLCLCVPDVVRRVRVWGRPAWPVSRFLVVGALPFLIAQGAVATYGQIDTVLLSFLTREAVVGWYTAAVRLLSVVQFLPAMLAIVTYPMLSATAGDPERYNAVIRRALSMVLVVNLPIAVGLGMLPDRIVRLLGYPAAFDHSVAPLMLLAFGGPLIAVDMVIATALSAADRQRQWATIGVVAALLNILLNMIAIPVTQHAYHNGAIGAAAITTVTELFLLVTGIRLLPRGAIDGHTVNRALRSLTACAAMAVVVAPLRGAPLPVPVLAGAVTYIGAALSLRAVRPDEIRCLRQQLIDRRRQQTADES